MATAAVFTLDIPVPAALVIAATAAAVLAGDISVLASATALPVAILIIVDRTVATMLQAVRADIVILVVAVLVVIDGAVSTMLEPIVADVVRGRAWA